MGHAFKNCQQVNQEEGTPNEEELPFGNFLRVGIKEGGTSRSKDMKNRVEPTTYLVGIGTGGEGQEIQEVQMTDVETWGTAEGERQTEKAKVETSEIRLAIVDRSNTLRTAEPREREMSCTQKGSNGKENQGTKSNNAKDRGKHHAEGGNQINGDTNSSRASQQRGGNVRGEEEPETFNYGRKQKIDMQQQLEWKTSEKLGTENDETKDGKKEMGQMEISKLNIKERSEGWNGFTEKAPIVEQGMGGSKWKRRARSQGEAEKREDLDMGEKKKEHKRELEKLMAGTEDEEEREPKRRKENTWKKGTMEGDAEAGVTTQPRKE